VLLFLLLLMLLLLFLPRSLLLLLLLGSTRGPTPFRKKNVPPKKTFRNCGLISPRSLRAPTTQRVPPREPRFPQAQSAAPLLVDSPCAVSYTGDSCPWSP
jgi:hypothetical protein